jgi:hypothetical protein
MMMQAKAFSLNLVRKHISDQLHFTNPISWFFIVHGDYPTDAILEESETIDGSQKPVLVPFSQSTVRK